MQRMWLVLVLVACERAAVAKQEVAPDEAERGDYAGAAHRELAFRYTAHAICQASQLIDRGMFELPAVASLDTHEIGESLGQVTCPLTAEVDATKRTAAAAAWSRQSSVLTEAEDRPVHGCYAEAGGSPPNAHLMPLLLVDETP